MTYAVSGKLLDACVLGVINKEDTYGYDLTQKIGSNLDISESALYPVLRRLSKEGLLTTYDKQFDGRNRKYYQITSEGIQKLKFFNKEWSTFKGMISEMLGASEEVGIDINKSSLDVLIEKGELT
ncbi:MAG: PadR family transcriptional regulator [bacterium]